MWASHYRIVADGRERLRREEQYRRQEREVDEAVRKKYEADLSVSSGLGRVLVYLRMQREIKGAKDDLAPERSSYLRNP